MKQRLQLSYSYRGRGGIDAVQLGLNVLTLQARRSHKEFFNDSFCKQVRSWARMMKRKKYKRISKEAQTGFDGFQNILGILVEQSTFNSVFHFFLKVLVSPYSYFKLICCIFVFIQYFFFLATQQAGFGSPIKDGIHVPHSRRASLKPDHQRSP